MKPKFIAYGALSMLMVASSCKRQDEAPDEQNPLAAHQQALQDVGNPLSANPTDEELLRLPQLIVKTPVTKTTTADGDVLLQRDMTAYLKGVSGFSKPKDVISGDDYGCEHRDAERIVALNRPHPSVKTLRKYFNEAAAEFNVPVALLMAIGQVQSNWAQTGESMYGSFGLMGLVENHRVKQISQAAPILGVSPRQIKEDARTNIRAAAALLAKYQNNKGSEVLEDWFDATKEVTGLTNPEMKESLAQRFYELINKGSKSVTLWGEIIDIASVKVNIDSKIKEAGNMKAGSKGFSPATVSAVDYPGALENLTTCNYGTGRSGVTIKYYFVHYIGEGTYQGAIDWFKECVRPNGPSSAHYVIRNSDGQVTQVVREANTAYSQKGGTNSGSVSTEHEVIGTNLAMWYSNAMMTSAGNLARNVCDRRAIPKVRAPAAPGINGHNDVWSTECPNMTAAVWNLFMSKVNPSPVPTGTFDHFNTGVGRFYSQPTATVTTVGISTTSTAQWFEGVDLRVTMNDDASVTTPWKVRLLSGGGAPANNVLLPKTGKVWFHAITSTAQPGATVRLFLDDSDGTEKTPSLAVAPAGVWHKYEWDLSTIAVTRAFDALVTDNALTAPNVTLDAIVMEQPNTSTIWKFYIDNVGKN